MPSQVPALSFGCGAIVVKKDNEMSTLMELTFHWGDTFII